LVQRLGELGGAIRHASAAVAELDCLLSLALAAREHNLRRPELTSANELVIKEGGSPRLEQPKKWQSVPRPELGWLLGILSVTVQSGLMSWCWAPMMLASEHPHQFVGA
jgi:hypothetical protein